MFSHRGEDQHGGLQRDKVFVSLLTAKAWKTAEARREDDPVTWAQCRTQSQEGVFATCNRGFLEINLKKINSSLKADADALKANALFIYKENPLPTPTRERYCRIPPPGKYCSAWVSIPRGPGLEAFCNRNQFLTLQRLDVQGQGASKVRFHSKGSSSAWGQVPSRRVLTQRTCSLSASRDTPRTWCR